MAGQPALFSAVAGLFGLLIGSFLNVVIHRLPIMLEHDWRRQAAEILVDPDTAPARVEDTVFNLL
ncbi:MAG TPA: prepilin peptidase, partial [Chromatiales bacterium]|nr:prepilin peptidase [Chromatiales bacterium]